MNKEILNYIKTLSDNKKIQELLIETIGKILSKQDNAKEFIKENERKLIHIRDWIDSIVENNNEWKIPRVLTVDALNNIADKHFEKQNNKIKTIELDETHEKFVADLGEYYIVKMLTPEALDNESKIMQHCVGHGGYDKKLLENNYQYLSLRDKQNKAHVTIEIYENKVLQLQGKQNRIPNKKYLEDLVKWLINNNYKINMDEYGFIFNENDKKIYSINEIPENCKINGDLNLSHSHFNKIPKNLVVSGSLSLNMNRNLEIIEKGLNVGHILNLNGCDKLKELPSDLIVGSDLNLNYTSILEIPNSIIINGCISLLNSKVERLFDNISGVGNLDLTRSNIKELPDNLIVNGTLNLYGCYNIKKLPSNLVIYGDLDLNNCENLEKLSDNLIVHGDLEICRTKITKLSEKLEVLSSMYLIDMDLEKIENDIKLEERLDISWSNIKEISKNIECKEIVIDSSQVKLIRKDMNFETIYINGITKYTKKEFFKKFRKKINEKELGIKC